MDIQQKQFLTIGATDSRRVQFWTQALQQKGVSHNLRTYQQIISGDFPKIIVPTLLRITSTGENFDLWKDILILGGCPYAAALSYEKGRIYPNPYWYRGWCKILQNITKFITENPLLTPINAPASIKLAFHKLKCQQLLNKQKIRTPKIVLSTVTSYDILIEKLQKAYANDSIMGFSVSIVDEKGILFEKGFGLSDLDPKKRYTSETVQPIASISKTLIGISLIKAEELGLIKMDDQQLPQWGIRYIKPRFRLVLI